MNVRTDSPQSDDALIQAAMMILQNRIAAQEQVQDTADVEQITVAGQESDDQVINYKFERAWKRNIADIQKIITSIERLPGLYNECYELLARPDQEAELDRFIDVLCEAVKQAESQLRHNDKPDMAQVKQIVADFVADNFPDIDDFRLGGKWELNEYLKDKWLADCQKCVTEVEQIRRRPMVQQR